MADELRPEVLQPYFDAASKMLEARFQARLLCDLHDRWLSVNRLREQLATAQRDGRPEAEIAAELTEQLRIVRVIAKAAGVTKLPGFSAEDLA